MIKVLIVDDSAFMRQFYKKAINDNPELTLIDTARNGEEALQIIKKSRPDVITLDIEMPGKNGLETLQEIMELPEPVPVIMVSSLNDRDTVFQALDMGAFDFVPKPSRAFSMEIHEIIDDLILKIKAAVQMGKPRRHAKKPRPRREHLKFQATRKQKDFPVIAIGSSSGGPRALKEIIPSFPANFPGAFVIVQHMPPNFTASLAGSLDKESALTVKEAAAGDQLKPGLVLLAPGGFHLEIKKGGYVELNKKPRKWSVRPAADYLLSSAAELYRENLIGVILTGMGQDGARGMRQVKKYQGFGIVEDKSTALVYGMPGATIKAGAYDEIIPRQEIPGRISRLISERFS